jgi:hypothetical protein
MVPAESRIEIEAMIQNKDIGFVEAGQNAEIKIDTFNFTNICYTTPLFTHGRLFCGSGDRHFYVVDLETMSLALKFDAGARVYSSPRLIGDSVIFGSNGGVVREIDPLSLEVTGRCTVPDAVSNAVQSTADGTRIFVPTYMNEIYAFERGLAQPRDGCCNE